MANEDFLTRVVAAIAGVNASVRSVTLAANPARLFVKQVGGGYAIAYERLLEVCEGAGYDSAVQAATADWAFSNLEEKTGLRIEAISETAIAKAIGDRAGIRLRSLSDVELIQEDLIQAASERIAARMGWSLDGEIRTPDALKAELLRRLVGEIERRVPGLNIRDISDSQGVADDVMQWAAGVLREKSGLPIYDPADVERTKAALLSWAEPRVMQRMSANGEGVGKLKMTKRAVQVRLAQRRFRAEHGNRKVYQPVE